MTAPLHYEYAVTRDTARQVAQAVVRYRYTTAAFAVPFALLAVLVVVFAVTGTTWLAVALAVGTLAVLATPLMQRPRLTTQLRARGFRPGTTITTDFGAESFVVTTPDSHATHAYGDVRSVRPGGGLVAIRLARAGVLVVLPEVLVPGEARRRMGSGGP